MKNTTFINKIDRHLRVIVEVKQRQVVGQHALSLIIYFQQENMGSLEFTLHGYSNEDIHALACNIKDNAFLMKEIDDYLCSDIE